MQCVGVVGVGYVGVHLVEVFSSKFATIGYDVSEARIEYLKGPRGLEGSNITYTTSPELLSECDLICIAVPTPLQTGTYNEINDAYIRSAVATVEKYAKPSATIVMESSVHVGMTRKLMGHLAERFRIGFSPERVDPGRIQPHCRDIPKIVSGIDEDSLTAVVSFYEQVFTRVVPVSTLETAEMCKLFENCFRMVNIAYVNEVADACEKHGIDPKEMIAACGTKPFGFMPFQSGLGVGGHCIPVNPFYLRVNCELPLLEAATYYTFQRPLKKAKKLTEKHPDAQGFLVIGIAFKPGESLTINSPGLALANELQNTYGKTVQVVDPLVDATNEKRLVSVDEALAMITDRTVDVVCVTIKQSNIDISLIEKTCQEKGVPFVSYV